MCRHFRLLNPVQIEGEQKPRLLLLAVR